MRVSHEELNKRCVTRYVEEHAANLSPSQKEEAIKIAVSAYKGNITLRDAGNIGIDYVKQK